MRGLLDPKDELVRISNNKEQREIYEMRSKILKDKVSALNEAERKGIEKGISFIAKNMKSLGFPVSEISKATGLTEEDINSL